MINLLLKVSNWNIFIYQDGYVHHEYQPRQDIKLQVRVIQGEGLLQPLVMTERILQQKIFNSINKRDIVSFSWWDSSYINILFSYSAYRICSAGFLSITGSRSLSSQDLSSRLVSHVLLHSPCWCMWNFGILFFSSLFLSYC